MMQPQPGAHQDWGLGHTLYVANGIDEYAVGHDGGNLPFVQRQTQSRLTDELNRGTISRISAFGDRIMI